MTQRAQRKEEKEEKETATETRRARRKKTSGSRLQASGKNTKTKKKVAAGARKDKRAASEAFVLDAGVYGALIKLPGMVREETAWAIRDVADRRAVERGCWFDGAAADDAVLFVETFCRHYKGDSAGMPLKLMRWQRDRIVRPLFGWMRPNGRRRFRKAYVEIPRKNGKSTLAAAIALLLMVGDGEMGASVVSAAADREQAREVFETARRMVQQSEDLSESIVIMKNALACLDLGANYVVISAEANTKHGRNDSGVIFDELHAQRDSALWDVLTSGIGSRSQPLVFAITTAGDERSVKCREEHDYAVGVLNGDIVDDAYFGFIAAAGEQDCWWDVRTWIKANPGLGLTVSPAASELALTRSPGAKQVSLCHRVTEGTEEEQQKEQEQEQEQEQGKEQEQGFDTVTDSEGEGDGASDSSAANEDKPAASAPGRTRSPNANASIRTAHARRAAGSHVNVGLPLWDGATVDEYGKENLQRRIRAYVEEVRQWAWLNENPTRSPRISYLADLCLEALNKPTSEALFKWLHLNLWDKEKVRWMPLVKWDQCAIKDLTLDDLVGRDCFAGLDLASKRDLCCCALIFPPAAEKASGVDGHRGTEGTEEERGEREEEEASGFRLQATGDEEEPAASELALRSLPDRVNASVHCATSTNEVEDRRERIERSWVVWPLFWVPEEGARERARVDRVEYLRWIDEGWLRATPGARADYARIRQDIRELKQKFRWREIGYDKWNAHEMSMELQSYGFALVEVAQTINTLSEPMKEVEALVFDRGLVHGGHPVMRWCVGNCVAVVNANEDIRPSKKHSGEKIDGVAAMVTGMARALGSVKRKSRWAQEEGEEEGDGV